MKPQEDACPHCGAALRGSDGTARRTTAALLIGLTAVALPATGASCSDDVETDDQSTHQATQAPVTAYGAGPIGGFASTPGVGGLGGAGGEGGAGGDHQGGAGGNQ